MDKLRAKLASFIRQLDRASASAVFQRVAHQSNGSSDVRHDERSGKPKHVATKAPEVPIPALIRPAAPSMDGAIHFYDELHRRRGEVRDVALPENDLPPKCDTELARTKRFPKHALRFRSVEPHVPRAVREKLPAVGRADAEVGLEHGVSPRARDGLGRSTLLAQAA